MKKAKRFEYGIEITKPWTSEMYDHNDHTADHLKGLIKASFEKTYTCEPIMETKLRDMAHEIVGYKYGNGFSLGDIIEETLKELDTIPNFQLHEVMHYLHHKGYVATVAMGLIGYQPDPSMVPYYDVEIK